MDKNNFQSLVQKITGRNLIIDTDDTEIKHDNEYRVYVTLPLTGMNISFRWKTVKNDERLLRSFITQFCRKYREPDPAAYNYNYGGKEYRWEWKTDIEKEYAHHHHISRMYSKDQLLKQVEANFGGPEIRAVMLRFGFYPTEYGVGIFCFWATEPVMAAINEMKLHLQKLSIPYTNEFSDARWVYRFKLGLTKPSHAAILAEIAYL